MMRFWWFLFIVSFSLGCRKKDKGVPEAVPLTPVELTGVVVSTSQVDLSWVDKSTNESGFRIQRKSGGANFSDIATVGKDVTGYSDKGLTPGTTYTYRVYAYNNAGSSPSYTNELTVSTWGPAVLTTAAVSAVSGTTCESGGNITSDGGSPIVARGVVWGTTANPTISLSTKTSDGLGAGSFLSKIAGLAENTTYYIRAYATNSSGTFYGNELTFKTLAFESGSISNPGTPNPYPFPSAANGGYIALGSFGVQTRFSVSMWVNPAPTQYAQAIILDASHGGSANWVLQTLNSGSSWGWGNREFKLTPNTWQHLLMTYDNGNRKVFVNGVEVLSWYQLISYSGSPSLYLGNWLEGGRRFSGAVDELYITRDIQQNANFTPPLIVASPSANTIGLWRFEEGSGASTKELVSGTSSAIGSWIWSSRK